MATVKYEPVSASGWVQVAATADDDVFIENQGTVVILVHYASSAPAVDAAGHLLGPGLAMVRLAPGNVYVKALAATPAALVIVSV